MRYINIKSHGIFIIMKIKQSIIILLIALFSVINIKGETVSQKNALSIATTFFNAANGKEMVKPVLVYTGRKLTTHNLFNPFYVYNHPAGGFVIISAENKAMPILGFSLHENFNPEELNPSILALLKGYARDIELIRYDDRLPEVAISAWNDINKYIAQIINAPTAATDILIEWNDATDIVNNIITTGRADELSSDLYSPSQWNELISEGLSKNGNVVVGVISENSVSPLILHGQKGGYFRMSGSQAKEWFFTPMPTEYLSFGQVADFNPDYNHGEIDNEDEEEPFSSLIEFINETETAKENKYRIIDEKLTPSSPVMRTIGGGRYEIFYPGKFKMARVYNLSGSLVKTYLYKDSDIASVSLESLPYGFYIVILSTLDGNLFEYKLAR